MADVISEILTIKQLLEAKDSFIGYAEPGDEEEVQKWPLRKMRFYTLPAYQREIKWAENNILTLIEDISKNNKKFLGNVILSTENKTEYDIIDGQQRLSVLLMILEAIRQLVNSKKNIIELCTFKNDTFPEFYNSLRNNFSEKENVQYIEKDKLNQRDTFERLWKYIVKIIKDMKNGDDESKLFELESKILTARVNAIITKVDPHDDESKRLCVDYFIDINNKGKRLDSTDILKAYALRNGFDEAAKKWILIQNNEKKMTSVYYPKESMYLHYFMCCINKYLESHHKVRLKGLSAEYEILHDVEIENKTYKKGTKVEELISDYSFYETMLNTLLEFQRFEQITLDCVGGAPFTGFAELFKAKDSIINMVSLKNYFKIVNGIIRNSDVVPKIMLLKYFIEVMKNPDATVDDFKILYDIDVLSIIFSAGNGNGKQLSSYASLVMSKNWVKSLHTRTQNALNKFPKNIRFVKEVQYINKPTRTSGQFLAHRVCGLTSAYKKDTDGKFAINEQGYNDYLYANLINDEHLIIPQSLKIQFMYKEKHIDDKPVKLPDKYASEMSYLANYLVIKREVNDELKTYNIKEKIRRIDGFIAEGKGEVFADPISEKIFETVKAVFNRSDCPTQAEIDAESSVDEAKKLIEKYYLDKFAEDFASYAKKINQEELFTWQ